MITDCYDIKTDPIVNLKDFYGEPKNIVDICLIIFSEDIHNHLLDTYECEKIGTLSTCGGDTNLHATIAFCKGPLGEEIEFFASEW